MQATEVVYGIALSPYPDDDDAFQVLLDAIRCHAALSAPINDGQQFAHLQSTINTDVGSEEFGRGA